MDKLLNKIFEDAKQGHTKYDVGHIGELEKCVSSLVEFLRENDFQASATYPIVGKKALLDVRRDGYSGAFNMEISKFYSSDYGIVTIYKAGKTERDSKEVCEYYNRHTLENRAGQEVMNKTLSVHIARTIVENSQPKKRTGFFQRLGLF